MGWRRRRALLDASAETGVVPGGYNAAMAVAGALEAYEMELRREVSDGGMMQRARAAYYQDRPGTWSSNERAMRAALRAALFGEDE